MKKKKKTKKVKKKRAESNERKCEQGCESYLKVLLLYAVLVLGFRMLIPLFFLSYYFAFA